MATFECKIHLILCLAAAKQNFSTKDTTQDKLESELQTWFGNARDRGEGGRKKQQQRAGTFATANNHVGTAATETAGAGNDAMAAIQ